jgi:hypothetical protein
MGRINEINYEDDSARSRGFESALEMKKLVFVVDILSHQKLRDFVRWKLNDGTKSGLLKLLNKLVENHIP